MSKRQLCRTLIIVGCIILLADGGAWQFALAVTVISVLVGQMLMKELAYYGGKLRCRK